ncbi:MAG: hypothetical protein O3C10_11495 [Chloroflexi bacterium]|nr:hypothetical protein [Chloroflexota bacterium]
MFDHRLMCRDVAGQLWAMYHGRPDAPSLLFPKKRDDSRRISEQESKILITQWLAGRGVDYSIETPTQGAYQQSGQAAMSARIDVTVYGSSHPGDRRLNMELKAGTSSLEAYRKDFEKLLREGIPGLWFHTLESASEGAWRSVERSMAESFSRLSTHADAAQHTVHFAFCVLDPPQLVEFDLDFSADWRAKFAPAFEVARHDASRPEWQPSPGATPAPKRAVARSYTGGQTKTLIYAPALEPSSFPHLNTQGDSYRLRSFTGERGVPSSQAMMEAESEAGVTLITEVLQMGG